MAPLAVKVTAFPLQNDAEGGVTEITGTAFTVAVAAVRVAETQPVLVFLACAY